jgi:ribosomal-protein-alanine N-acetyltransferase
MSQREDRTLIRWSIRRDLPEILIIDSECFNHPWNEEMFLVQLRRRDVICLVYEVDYQVVGYVMYRLVKDRLTILRMGVAAGFRFQKIATGLIDRLKEKLSHDRRQILYATVPEYNLPFQLFLKSCGFQAISIENGGDEYGFLYTIKKEGAKI